MNRPEQAIPLFKVYMNPSAKDAACEVLDSGYIGPVSYTHLTLQTNREV